MTLRAHHVQLPFQDLSGSWAGRRVLCSFRPQDRIQPLWVLLPEAFEGLYHRVDRLIEPRYLRLDVIDRHILWPDRCTVEDLQGGRLDQLAKVDGSLPMFLRRGQGTPS